MGYVASHRKSSVRCIFDRFGHWHCFGGIAVHIQLTSGALLPASPSYGYNMSASGAVVGTYWSGANTTRLLL